MEPTYRIAQRLLASRAAVGVKQYGDDLTANSPGCMIVHALEEAADQVNYLLAEIQRRADAIRKLIAMVDDMEAQGYWPMMHRANAVIDLLGGRAALAQYDEILGTVAENATVAPPRRMPKEQLDRIRQEIAKVAASDRPLTQEEREGFDSAMAELPETHEAPDPRDEALRVAEKALALVCYNEDRVTGFDHLIHRMDMEACKDALAAIRAAGGAR